MLRVNDWNQNLIEINRVLNYIVTENMTLTSRFLKVTGCAVAKKLRFKLKLTKNLRRQDGGKE